MVTSGMKFQGHSEATESVATGQLGLSSREQRSNLLWKPQPVRNAAAFAQSLAREHEERVGRMEACFPLLTRRAASGTMNEPLSGYKQN